ncbi:ergothioneine biosynthesis glutamate--cysteine ligase EgtA [uncultured Jatrophihabitans sp.]|uniref:ergothioneine biosynthesis glutamate--cysteine ligase EgtA n=1 Tax=uncultured Jatrophihabitans sp. TaxID=1610747 RepID=UPI0035CB6D21
MTAQYVPAAPEREDSLDATLHDPRTAVAAARAHIAGTALREPTGTTPGSCVGLELEMHLVDLADPGSRPSWPEVVELTSGLPPMPCGSAITLEPGGQIELSAPPAPDVSTAIAGLQADREALTSALRSAGFGAASLGADPARPVQRINPSARYAAMEQHFDALGCLEPGRAMMSATAALQLNVDAGPADGWAQRLGRIRDLGPLFIAMSACSPYLGGRASGWQSMRQQAWHGIDHSRSDPVSGDDPADAWATYALHAPVMLLRDGADAVPMRTRVPLAAWLDGSASMPRRPTVADVDYHLTTLFPPVRPRGYVEIRCLDAVPDRWLPALTAVAVTLIEDPVAGDCAARVAAPIRDLRAAAARDALSDPAIRAAVLECVETAAARVPEVHRRDAEAFAELLAGGRTPGDEVRERIEADGPLAALLAAATEEDHRG